MADFVFNIAKGRVVAYAANVQGDNPVGSVLTIVPVTNAAQGTNEGTLKDYDNLSLLLGDADVAEMTTGNWSRKSIDQSGVNVSVDDTGDQVTVDITSDPTWTAVAAGNDVDALVICYDPDGSGTPGSMIPLTMHDFNVTTDGSDITAVINASGFFRAS